MDNRPLRPGDHITVEFGSFGTQRAVVDRITGTGSVYVRKYRASSRTWTKPVRVMENQILHSGWQRP